MSEAASDRVKSALGLTDEDLTSLFSALEIKEEQKEHFLLKLTDAEWANAPIIKEAVAYLGFDARKIIAQFFKKAEENPRLSTDTPTLTVGTAQLYEKNDARTDLLFLITVFLARGNNLSKALLRCEPAIADVIKRKCNAYGIQIEKRQNASILGTSHLTLARIAQAFAPATAAIIIGHDIKGKLTSRVFEGALPTIMQHTKFPGLIPSNTNFSDDLKYIACVLNAEMSILLSTPKEKRKMMARSFEDLMEEAQTFVDAAKNGSALTDGVKIKVLVKANLLSVDADNKPPAITATPTLRAMTGQISKVRQAARHTYLNNKSLREVPGSLPGAYCNDSRRSLLSKF